MQRLLVVVVLAWLSVVARADPFPDRTERVIGAGRVWAQVKFFHPWLGYKTIDWDAAFTEALPTIEAAKTTDEYRAALKRMLEKLGDPVTHVVAPAAAATTPKPASGDWLSTPSPGVLLVDLAVFTAGGFDYVGYQNKAEQVVAEAAKAKVLVIDLRGSERDFIGAAIDDFITALPAIERWPIERTVEHHGFATQQGQTSGGYYSTYSYQGAQPPKPAPPKGPTHVVAIADGRTAIPASIIALQAAGSATIVGRALVEDNAVTTTNVPAAGGIEVQLRLGELLWGPPTADVVVATGDLRTKALEVAKRVAGQKPAQRTPRPPVLPQYTPRFDADYATTPYPSRELRVLAGIRAWAILDRFWPYRYLVADWDKALRDTLPKLESAADDKAYLLALRELGARAGDGHINVWPLKRTDGPMGTPAIKLDVVEGRVTVVKVGPAVKTVAVGDVIETIGDKPAAAVLAEKRVTESASTAEARDHNAAVVLLAGPDGSTIKVGVRGASGVREVPLVREAANWQVLYAPAIGPHWKKLPNNIGYADLRTLTVPEVDTMFKELGGTKAIVFDMRGYPQGTAWAIAPRINVKGAKYGAQFFQPYVVPSSGADQLLEQRVRFLQGIPPLPPGASIYRGKIVVLINSDAISQSEHSCLFFQETAGATFIGSPTAGANGDVTVMRLPGGVRMSFTGQEVRHVDGKQLQRVGIQPHIVVRPSVAGLRAGKDEVLDRALQWLATGK